MKAAELLGINNFSTLLPRVVENINHCEIRPFAYRESPASVNDPAYDPYIRILRKYTRESKGNGGKRSRLPILHVGDNVWLDLKAKNFAKGKNRQRKAYYTLKILPLSGFDPKRGQIYKIAAIDKKQKPWFYKLEDELGRPFPFPQYRARLRKAPSSTKELLYPVEKIVGHRRQRGKKQVKVRWLFYGPAFDTWEDEESIVDPKK